MIINYINKIMSTSTFSDSQLAYYGNIPHNLEGISYNDIIHGMSINMKFCIYIFNLYKEDTNNKLVNVAVSLFISKNYINSDLIARYKPMNFTFQSQIPIYIYRDLICQFKYLKYPLACLYVVRNSGYNDSIKDMLELPEINIINVASDNCNSEVYHDQLEKANKLGFLYQFFDMDKCIYFEEPKKVGLNTIPSLKNEIFLKYDNDEHIDYILQILA